MSSATAGSSPFVLSYLILRRAVGCLGLALPGALAVGGLVLFGQGLQTSISDYYYTGMRDVFVGILCAIAVFLLSYKGYDRRDDLAGDLACVFAVGAALFPTTPDAPTPGQQAVGIVHLIFAALFLLTLAYFSLVLFTKSDPKEAPTPRKLLRNRVYRACGYVILGALALIALSMLLPGTAVDQVKQANTVFWLESVAVVAFGVSWFVKGEAILADKP